MSARLLALLLAGLWSCAWAQEEEPESPPQQPVPAMAAPEAAQYRLMDIAALGPRLVAAGEQGVVLTSADGKSWQQAEVPVSAMLTRLRFTSDKDGWALGYDASILQTSDGGAHWSLRHFDPKGRPLYDLIFLDAQHGIAVGAYGSYLETRDGGKTWAAQDNSFGLIGMHLNQLLSLSDGSLLVVGERGLTARSTDAGATWQMLDMPYAGSWYGALPYGDKGVLVYGMRGNVFVTDDLAACTVTDAGNWDPYAREILTDPAAIAALGWRKLDTPTKESLFGAWSFDPQTAMFVGINGTTLKLDRGTGAVTAVAVPADETLNRLVEYQGRILGVGSNGVQDLGAAP